jgi:hypothetical protein
VLIAHSDQRAANQYTPLVQRVTWTLVQRAEHHSGVDRDMAAHCKGTNDDGPVPNRTNRGAHFWAPHAPMCIGERIRSSDMDIDHIKNHSFKRSAKQATQSSTLQSYPSPTPRSLFRSLLPTTSATSIVTIVPIIIATHRSTSSHHQPLASLAVLNPGTVHENTIQRNRYDAVHT